VAGFTDDALTVFTNTNTNTNIDANANAVRAAFSAVRAAFKPAPTLKRLKQWAVFQHQSEPPQSTHR
jgi:hypothetical protein